MQLFLLAFQTWCFLANSGAYQFVCYFESPLSFNIHYLSIKRMSSLKSLLRWGRQGALQSVTQIRTMPGHLRVEIR